MLTLLKNIERFNKRYNKKRGSAMLMVLMTMAIIIVVGTSMLFVTLSSFSNSIADTQQERAYNAALTVSDTLKGSTQLNTIIETYFTKIKENGSAEVQFYNDTDFENQAVNYTIVNGVKVYVTLSKSPNSSANKIDKVLVDIKGVKGSQESTVSFEADSVPAGNSTTIQDTFGNSFVVSNNMGSEVTSPYQIFKRIEGDVSINCFENDDDGNRVMKTRIFNPIVLEGVTGSIYANGDLIIGAPNNMLRVQGNVYVDGNLTIRGLALGVNLPALTKKYYAKKYIYYHTYAYKTIGSIAVPPNNNLTDKNSSTTLLGEAMYEKLSDGTYRPIQTYDKLSHFTLMDLAGDANEYTFWTKNYGENNTTGNYTWEQVTITLRVKDKNGIWQNVDAEYNQGGINNAQYLGASMYKYTPDGSEPTDEGTPIMQYPEGGNVYCSGDIIFDTVNYGSVISYDAGILNLGTTDNEQEENKDDDADSSTLSNLADWIKNNFGIDLVNPEISYYSLAYNLDGKGDGTIPVHTKIEGDVFCQGRMIIAPDTKTSYKDYKGDEKLNIAPSFSWSEGYINTSVISKNEFTLGNGATFLAQIKNKWKELTGSNWGEKSTINMIKPITVKKKPNEKIELNVGSLKNVFDELAGGDYSYLVGGNYTRFGQYFDKEENKWVNYNNIAEFRTPSFSETSNLYIQNSPIRKGTSCGDEDHKNSNNIDPCTLEKYASDDQYRVVENVAKKDKDGKPVTTRTEVGGISYTAALSVRYCTITVNNVFCNGTISVLESKIPGFNNPAYVEVKNEYLNSVSIKSELKNISILDYLREHLKLTDEQILKNYFNVTGENSNVEAKKTWNSTITYDDFTSVGENIKIVYERKVIVLRAALELDETAKWENDPKYEIIKPTFWNSGIHSKHHSDIENNWKKTEFDSDWRYYADLMYVVEEKRTIVSGNPNSYQKNYYNLKGKVMDSEGKEASHDDKKAVKDLVEKIEKKLEEMTETQKDEYINYVNTKFLNSIDTDEYREKVYNEHFKDEVKEFGDEPIKEKGVQYEREQIKCKFGTYGIVYNCFKIDKSASYKYTVGTYKKKVDEKVLEGGTLTDKEKVLSIDRNYIMNSGFLTNRQLITMFSNKDNDFGGIVNENMVTDDAIKDGNKTPYGTFDALIRGTNAFDKDGKHKIYGMYLAKDKKYEKVNNDAYVQAIFDEIKSPEFATVVEANTDQEKAKEGIKKILNNLKKEGQLNEYNAFDIYGATNADETQTGKTEQYVCSKNDKLTKKYVRSTFKKPDINNVMTYLQTLTFPDSDPEKWWNIERWYFVEHSNKVEDDSNLRLMDFYNKDKANSPHLRADSTFAIDEKYNQTFTGLKDKELDGFDRVAVRSEVQYTIDQNTYFNFIDSKKEIVFGASKNGLDKMVRMNFLIDTSKKDIYIFFHCDAYDALRPAGSKEDYQKIRFVFQKCTFQVTGKNNAYIMLVDDTSFAANAYKLEVSDTISSEDKTDEKVGTHFKSNTYQKYIARFKGHGNTVSALKLGDLTDALQMKALPEGEPDKAGYMFIIGMGKNRVKFGRGGSVNAMVYIPNGKYSNETSGILNFIPIANSGNNESSIVAKDIYIGGSNRGQLIFTSYDAAKIGSKNNNSSGLVMDGLINPDNVTHGTKWVAGDYYYG